MKKLTVDESQRFIEEVYDSAFFLHTGKPITLDELALIVKTANQIQKGRDSDD
ncbi:hypothetical protein FC72_GL000508 [Companilactobacillus tucceti DSM 20183]|uniref:Uncharacterized protein n=1 Tax=Companilactobacillus tucceti DSM 20183 TaxID=1423811 RepID=A0A0R1J881_9LACO|nr:hypothetical protein [Companilactobacillus tucceti]KRK64340.1 hypothetical protein FC72_GL000508 [Companilactobacillus tucceti DSM 20183]